MSRQIGTILLCTVLFAVSIAAAPTRQFYVAPDGDDGNPGTKSKPLQSFAGARDAVRREIADGMTADVVVQFAPGNYFTKATTTFDERDSGRDGHVVIYRGAPNCQTKIYGGLPVTAWEKDKDGWYKAKVTPKRVFYTLYENERAANGGSQGFTNLQEGNWRLEGETVFYRPRNLPIDEQVIVAATTKRVLEFYGSAMDKPVENIRLEGLYFIGSDFAPRWKRGHTYAENYTGEYEGEQLKNHRMGDGEGHPDMRHGLIFLENARNVALRFCKIYGAGFPSIYLNYFAQNNEVYGCWIENAGTMGIVCSGYAHGRGPFKSAADSYVNKRNRFANNFIYDCGRFAYDGAGIFLAYSGDNLIEHNVISQCARYAISLKGGWFNRASAKEVASHHNNILPTAFGKPVDLDPFVALSKEYIYDLNHTRNNRIRYNDVSCSPTWGHDAGIIESWGPGKGNVIENNACHDWNQCFPDWDAWGHIIFNDDASGYTIVRDNILYWCSGGKASGALMAKSINEKVENNIVADCDLGGGYLYIGKYNLPAYGQKIRHNLFASKVDWIYSGCNDGVVKDPDAIKQCDYNLFFPESPGLDRAHAFGWDKNSIVADPLFERKHPACNATYTDYRVKPGSPATNIGFRQIAMDDIGLLEDFPFDRDLMFLKDASEPWQGEYHDRIYQGRTNGGDWSPGRARSQNAYIYHMVDGSWTRYSNMNFGQGQLKRLKVRATYNDSKADKDAVAIEVRLDAPDGVLIGQVTNGADGCDIQRVEGVHRLFLVFRQNRIKTLDWFQFE